MQFKPKLLFKEVVEFDDLAKFLLPKRCCDSGEIFAVH